MNKKRIFAVLRLHEGQLGLSIAVGFFYVRIANMLRQLIPCLHRNGIGDPSLVEVLATGNGLPFLFFSPNILNSFKMLRTNEGSLNGTGVSDSDRQAHDTGTATTQLPIVSNPYSIPCFEDYIAEAIRHFDIEMNAKNEAYAFILSSGLLDDFRRFSRTYKGEANTPAGRIALISKNL